MTASASEAASIGSVAVVGSKYCLPYAVRLTITKDFSLSDGDFTVKDVNGEVVFRVMGNYLSFNKLWVLVNAGGKPLLTMQQKMLSVHQGWRVFRGESTEAEDLVFSVKDSNPLQLNADLDVFVAGNSNEEACDFKMKGNLCESTCTIYQGNSGPIIAQMSREFTMSSLLFGAVLFRVRVYPNVDYAFVAALIVLFHRVHRGPFGE